MLTPVLEIGGTHVTAALVGPDPGTVHEQVRTALPAQGTLDEILGAVAATASRVSAPAWARWGVAVPGPFDYEAGIGLFQGVGKFDALYGVDLRAELLRRLAPSPGTLHFLNDADAFSIGESIAGAAAGHRRAVCITLGSGVGSAFVDRGKPVNDGPLVPQDGSAHLLTYGGRPMEDTVSRRAIRAAYARAALDDPDVVPEVRTIAELARGGETHARAVLDHAFRALGETLAPWINRFEATALVVGGSIAASWDLIEAPLRIGLTAGPNTAEEQPLTVCTAARPDDAPLLGAARWARQAMRTRPTCDVPPL
ncbi:ROK family protein [Streptomyces sp. NBC_01285]|uniref:ROK family protein n=1 Tax=Streptomyces sp. NBC_01285 TaxID=2903813 RepID=UPI0022575B43|nr:ROK family protein [Streptomyces sp. NBC_01285]MCX4775257.1 ROK family protein [Streptomyces sp. NBC_01285]